MDAKETGLLCLLECPRLGPVARGQVVRHFRGAPPPGFFGHSADWYAENFPLPRRSAEALAAYTPERHPVVARRSSLPVQLCSPYDPGYPARLRRMPAPPTILSVYGTYNKEARLSVAVVTSREPSRDVLDEIKGAAEAATAAGATLVAGHNRPAYQLALLAAKRSAARSVMVLDRGILAAFDEDLRRDPLPAGRIWGYAFDTERSAAISPFRLRDGWVGSNGRIRDAIVVALADVVIAVGLRPGGTMLALCGAALQRGQTVLTDPEGMALLGAAGAARWEGCLPAVGPPPEGTG